MAKKINDLDYLLKNQVSGTKYDHLFQPTDLAFESSVTDETYLNLLSTYTNGGYFFSCSLLIYPYLLDKIYPSSKVVNEVLHCEFNELFLGFTAFGQDIFGNQFCFEDKDGKVFLFNIENRQKDFLAGDFAKWLKVLEADYDYLTGYTYAQEWTSVNILRNDERLCPKIPFTIGGDFKISNFYTLPFPVFIQTNASLAKHIVNLPDGTSVKLKIIPPGEND